MTGRRRQMLSWLVFTLPLAALWAVVYAAFEWLFIVTRPSALDTVVLVA